MSPPITALTYGLLLLPLAFLAGGLLGTSILMVPALLIVAVYVWIWLWFRPTRFIVRPGVLEVAWPLRRRYLRRDGISDLRLLGRRELRSETGSARRVGAGGFGGGFGWLWTQKRGLVRMYISRTDGFVWIERGGDRPWLITPERPEEFVRILRSGA